ncbi:hypothetical protein DdX_12299 [Ditylenchus destructor]|uniref:C2H2-type domain-containing protein n=1 Tax=Ditylenchus destructor TaxID=166010 RepID=A0AAD4MVX8_9BILA|nr:hypothetical protein DdX_12299 [Ditylenchus destructor]
MIEVTCCLCSKISSSVTQLESHLALKHFNSNPYQCEVCLNSDQPSTFPTEDSIRDHIAREHGAPKFCYRVWGSAEIDRERAEIRKCIDKSVETSMTRTQSPSVPAAFICESPFISHTNTTPTFLEHITENIRDDSPRSSLMNGHEEHLPAVTESDRSANIADLIGALKAEPDVPMGQIKREPKSFVSEQENMGTFDEKRDELDERRTSWPPSRTPKSSRSSNLMHWLSHGSSIANQSGSVEKTAKKKAAKKKTAKKTAANKSFTDQSKKTVKNHGSPTANQSGAVEKTAKKKTTKKKIAKKNLPDQSMKTVQNISHKKSERRRISHQWLQKQRMSQKMKCSECEVTVGNHVTIMKRHLNTKHVKLPMHTCKVCDKVFYAGEIHVALNHVRRHHKGDLENVIDQKAENWAALNDHLAEYFQDASFKEQSPKTSDLH